MNCIQYISILSILALTFSSAFAQNEKDQQTFEELTIDNFYETVKDLRFETPKRMIALDQLFGIAVFNSYRIDAPQIVPVVNLKDSTVSNIDCFIENVLHTVNPKQSTSDRIVIKHFYAPSLVALDAKIFRNYTLSWHVLVDEQGVHQIHFEEANPVYKLYEEDHLKVSGFYEHDYGIDTIVKYDPHTFEKSIRIIRRDSYIPNKVGTWKYYNDNGEMIREENHEVKE